MDQPNMLSTGLYTADTSRQLNQVLLEKHHLSPLQLSTRKANAVFVSLQSHWVDAKEIHVFCGGDNNSSAENESDYVWIFAALAAKRGLQVTVWQLCSHELSQSYQYAVQEDVAIKHFSLSAWQAILIKSGASIQTPVVIDALFGIEENCSLKDLFYLAIESINEVSWPVLSIDIPAGINSDSGTFLNKKMPANRRAIKADATVSYVTRKAGAYIGEGRNYTGVLFFNDLGLSREVITGTSIRPVAHIIDYRLLLAAMPERALDSHKGSFGHVLVVGGDEGFGGAPLMAAQMAARTGAGLVGVATQAVNTSAIIARQPELMAVGVASGQVLLPLLQKPTVIVVGPGLGQSAWSEQLLYHVLGEIRHNKPLVIDADGLNLLAAGTLSLPNISGLDREANWVLTPHPGEAARLLKTTIEVVQSDRIAACRALQKKYGGTIVLKGAGTLVLTNNDRLFVCDAGNVGMATGGMGDVLSGLIGGLLAQGLTPEHAACLGVVLHAMAGDLAVADSGIRGLLATDLIPYVRLLLDDMSNV